jgi:F0F1-type ATP synthase membrane subunit b/b'
MTDRAADLADGVTAAVGNEAQAQGLTAENLKQSTSDASRKVQNIIAESTERLRSAT